MVFIMEIEQAIAINQRYVFQSNNEGRVSRGQVSFLLQIPFIPGPSGRKTMHFICATRWNKLPHNIRSICNLSQFKCSISEVDLLSPVR